MSKYKFLPNYNIEAEGILMRPFTLEDAKVVSELCNNYNIYKNTLVIPYPYSEEDGIDWIQYQIENFDPDRELNFAIIDKTTSELVGCVGLICSQIHLRCEIGYWIGEKYWGNGYATEAAKAAIAYVFEIMGYNKVYAKHFTTNPSSGKVMEKAGMKYEGTEREHYIKNGDYIDVASYSILRKEYK